VTLLRRSSKTRATRLLYVSDVHGSVAAWRKLVNAARFYRVDVLVFGGDLTGKATVPVVAQADGSYRAELHGQQHALDGGEAVEEFTRRAENVGFYWALMDRDRYEALEQDTAGAERLFVRLARERLAAWIEFAEERLKGTGVRLFLTGGNDDMPEVLTVLDHADGEVVVPSEHRVVQLDRQHTMITVGYSTPTPWGTPREATESELARFIDDAMSNVPDAARCVFNVHVPPLDSGLDRCLKVDATRETPTVMKDSGRPVYYGAGSRAVLEAIRRYQPMAGLHGHIHESPGHIRYGRTKCFNPGSEYQRGILSGLLASVSDGVLVGYQHTTG
jgi:Icc-related predicted phosphoesterase